MGGSQMKIKNSKGFTLIELLIVVAIIAILAAIAIPQFSAYRIRGYNASANSDVRNLATAQEALFADTQAYGAIANAILPGTTPACPAGPTVIGGPLSPATSTVAGAYLYNGRGSAGFSISNQVAIGVSGDVGAAPAIPCVSYVIVAKHTAGDACYGRDAESTSSYRAKHTGGAGIALVVGDVPAALSTSDQLGGLSVGACSAFAAQ
jgi:type IV pilus assembly protein PilA